MGATRLGQDRQKADCNGGLTHCRLGYEVFMITTTAMRLTLLFLLLVGNLAISQPASAASGDGNELYQWLLAGKKVQSRTGSAADYFPAGQSLGFVSGVASALERTLFCFPVGMAKGQLTDIVLQYLETHPEERHLFGVDLVIMAIGPKFPCSK